MKRTVRFLIPVGQGGRNEIESNVIIFTIYGYSAHGDG
jgi:hypothetical protein